MSYCKGSYENLLIYKDIANTSAFDYFISKKDIHYKNTIVCYNGVNIYEAEWRHERVCVKEIDNNELICNELLILSKCIHPKIVQFLGFYRGNDKTSILFEYMDNGNLYEYIKTNTISERQKISMLLDITKALHYLHNRYPDIVIHRDLKPTNILVNKHNEAKLSDFGISKMINKTTSNDYHEHSGEKGTYIWMPPEVLKGEYYNHTADIYSLGLIMYFIWTETIPFIELNLTTIQLMFKKHSEKLSTKPLTNFFELNKLIERCTSYAIDMRPDTVEIINTLSNFLENDYCKENLE
uniref:Tyrosine-protein kinase transforming protein Abl n=1 Tax=Pyramimonas orientalis virus TaxID=455367 RepID=A0A7L9AY21_POV01|nr:tyrosine-protein kinase transforming protein Abl [Pyramimonas orientalis virus]